jgi:hypothetical protein
MTDIFVYCPICNKEDGKEMPVTKMTVVNGMVVFLLICGHTVTEGFKYP